MISFHCRFYGKKQTNIYLRQQTCTKNSLILIVNQKNLTFATALRLKRGAEKYTSPFYCLYEGWDTQGFTGTGKKHRGRGRGVNWILVLL